MGNTMSGSNPYIPLTQTFQEMEKIQFSYDLRKNPDDFNRYVSERTDRIAKETMEKKRASFQKAHTDLGRYMDMDHNAGYYSNRNNDLLYVQGKLLEQSRAAVSGMKHDKDLTRRQTEINEWYFNDKLETLFFLQIFFITMLGSAIVLYFQKNGMISAPFAAFLTAILLAIVIGTGLYRNQYTANTRDARFWHRRSFYDKKLYIPTKSESDCACDSTSNLIPGPLSQCAQKGLDAAKNVNNAAQQYAADSAKPYGQAALAGWQSVTGGADTAGSGIVSGWNQATGGAGIALRSIGSQALSDSRANYNRIGDAASRVESQLEADAAAYITGNGIKRPSKGNGLTCPF
uniref:Uncharacterized protein n=1 Tax=viral metagenome TaxID=1070528 RepID=A0A6C0DVH8_9ZZZZ